jgi:uncharacterized membrane protein
MQEAKLSKLTVVLVTAIVILAVIGVAVSIVYPDFVFQLQPGEAGYVPGGTIFEIIYILLTMATDVLYLVGGGIVFFGGLLVTIRFLQSNPENPHKAHEATRHLSGYLNLGLAFFIGAEIVRTVVIRTPTEFELLILTIVSRGLFSLILYLERRWHGAAESD